MQVVLLILDLRDPRLTSLQMEGADELAFASHLNCEWRERQVYRNEPDARIVRLVYEVSLRAAERQPGGGS